MRLLILSFSSFAFFLFLLLSAFLPLAGAEGITEYRDSGLSLDVPRDWLVNASGEYAAGNLSIRAPDANISLIWMRDPGIDPEKILGQVEKTYDSDEIKILSSELGHAKINSQEVKTLSLYYKLKEYKSMRLFAVWNSSKSDRLFFAYISSYSDDFARAVETLNQVLKNFEDLGGREVSSYGSRASGDAWAIVLGDLLASYSYKEAVTLPPRDVHLQTLHSLQPSGGAYSISSGEMLWIDLPEMAAARAGAMQDLLGQKGYETSLIQGSGNIWVIVRDPTGRWQPVSLNPKEPKRMIGVLVNDSCHGVVYESVSDLAKDNLMSLSDSHNNLRLMQKDCEPSIYAELKMPSSENRSWIKNLQNILDSYDYEKSYLENVFDCSNISQICWSILQRKGYDARLMMSYKGHPLDPHMWIVVKYPYEAERYVAVEATNTDKNKKLVHLGIVTTKEKYYKGIMYNSSAQFSRLHPEEGMWLSP